MWIMYYQLKYHLHKLICSIWMTKCNDFMCHVSRVPLSWLANCFSVFLRLWRKYFWKAADVTWNYREALLWESGSHANCLWQDTVNSYCEEGTSSHGSVIQMKFLLFSQHLNSYPNVSHVCLFLIEQLLSQRPITDWRTCWADSY